VSVLELGGRLPETPAEQAVQDMAASARTADVCGYHRLWVAEHHSSTKTASSFPAVLIAHLAAQTRRVRLGSGGVMLPNHAPFSVAEQFATLQALHPGRIDLGLGRSSGGGVGTHKLLAEALRRSPTAISEFPALIDELLGFLHHRGPDGNRFHDLPLTPHTATPPQVHVLGAGENSARIAAERGLPLAYGHHLSRRVCRPQATARYRSSFSPGPGGARPHLIAAVNVVCRQDDEQAEHLALRIAAERLDPAERPGGGGPLTARTEHLARQLLEEFQVVCGAPATLAARLDALAAALDADELMLAPFDLTAPERARTLALAATALATPLATAAARSGRGAGPRTA
jgi:luciferase family oxidoreductase group 1